MRAIEWSEDRSRLPSREPPTYIQVVQVWRGVICGQTLFSIWPTGEEDAPYMLYREGSTSEPICTARTVVEAQETAETLLPDLLKLAAVLDDDDLER